ncbi:MAG: ester cyclase [Cyanobacteria bacterium P01_F01_bin.53]
MNKEQNRALAHRFITEGWGTAPGWDKVWDEMVAPDVVYHFNSEPNPIVGLEANKAFNAELFQGFPTLNSTLEDLLIDGNNIVYRQTLQGKHTGEFLGIPATGKSVKINDFTFLKIANGKIAEWWYDCNLLAAMQQLGVVNL